MHLRRDGLRPLLIVESEAYGELETIQDIIQGIGVILALVGVLTRFTGLIGSVVGLIELGIALFLAARLVKLERSEITEEIGIEDDIEVTMRHVDDE
ncbi:hypothetical protein [Halosimplex carlsbadense]|uniref:hypothetical protein n=1 Tax=Halosimplex carlsbadense TaxID=171164 RepID=UPI001267DBA1|nr:hypothetical protein [Halosimplex carlsbadense]